MIIDWQIIAVSLIVLAAVAYVARRGLARLRSFRLSGRGTGGGDSSCATGCGSCGDGAQKTPATRDKRLVQINRPSTTPPPHNTR